MGFLSKLNWTGEWVECAAKLKHGDRHVNEGGGGFCPGTGAKRAGAPEGGALLCIAGWRYRPDNRV
jgi:hypothetical protein